MRATSFATAAAVAIGVSGTAFAQQPAPSVATSAATSAATITTATTTTQTTPYGVYGSDTSHWLASAFAGSNFGLTAVDPSISFGGEVGYLWHYIGAEFLGEFAPDFQMGNVLLADDPHVNTYMANVIAAVPFGADGEWQPYVSGGVGAIQMSTHVFNFGAPANGTSTGNQSRLGANFGGGLMGYGGSVGFKVDLRYYKATSDDNFTATIPAELFTQGLLSGIDFWRLNAGVVWRW